MWEVSRETLRFVSSSTFEVSNESSFSLSLNNGATIDPAFFGGAGVLENATSSASFASFVWSAEDYEVRVSYELLRGARFVTKRILLVSAFDAVLVDTVGVLRAQVVSECALSGHIHGTVAAFARCGDGAASERYSRERKSALSLSRDIGGLAKEGTPRRVYFLLKQVTGVASSSRRRTRTRSTLWL